MVIVVSGTWRISGFCGYGDTSHKHQTLNPKSNDKGGWPNYDPAYSVPESIEIRSLSPKP